MKFSKSRSEKFNANNAVIDFEKAGEERKKKRGDLKRRTRAFVEEIPAADDIEVMEVDEDPEVQVVTENKRRRRRRKVKLTYLIVIVLMLAIIGGSGYNVFKLKMEERALKKEEINLKARKAALIKEKGMVDDNDYIEQEARKRLKLIKQGEILYLLPKGRDEKE